MREVVCISPEQSREEYFAILAVFIRWLDELSTSMSGSEIMEELMSLRARFAIQHAFRGFGMDWDTALELLRSSSVNLTQLERDKRDIIIAAVENLVDFAVVEEYQMGLAVIDSYGRDRNKEKCISICHKYNGVYATIENDDVFYAMTVAAQLVLVSWSSTLTYMTQGDERVRPWHMQYEGFTATKENFPAWLIPPIEHACRCYLVEDIVRIVNAIATGTTMPDWFNPTFKESVALGGRIFSDEHPYFNVVANDASRLREIANKIKSQYYYG